MCGLLTFEGLSHLRLEKEAYTEDESEVSWV
jgi:hypothetical protein